MLKGKELLNEKVERYITDLLKEGKLKEGDRLLSERELGKVFKISSMPVRQATQNLVKTGILERIKGKGTYVRRRRVQKPFVKSMDKIGVAFWPPHEYFFRNPFYSPMLRGIEILAEKEQKTLLFRSLMAPDNKGPLEVIENLQDEVDGLLLVDILPSLMVKIRGKLSSQKKPMVVLHYEDVPDTVDSITFDTAGNVRKMVSFLIQLGHTRIGLMGVLGKHDVGEDYPTVNIMYSTFKEQLAANNLPLEEGNILESLDSQAEDDFKKMMAGLTPPSALFCHGDARALSAIQYTANMGLKVPQDLTVVGYGDNIVDWQYLNPHLTTLHLPKEEMGMLGLKRLLERIEGNDKNPPLAFKSVLPGYVVERKSHKSIKSHPSTPLRMTDSISK